MLRNDARYERLPVAVVTARELDPVERARLERAAVAILGKGPGLAPALRRLVQETAVERRAAH
ncbi:MAG TPA: hypothetical protein VFU46_05755 [Gemmatimonadales bacterium]|nr:hypothetical protein [Gemmatimonadales bacterium]